MDWPLEGRAELVRQIAGAIQGRPGSAVLQGDLGVGKTRLARAVADEIRSLGWHVEVCIGSAAAAPIPFGALSHLIDFASSVDAGASLERMRRALLRRAEGSSLLLLVDDANHLDHRSMTLVHRLAAFGDAAVLATRRTGEPGNDETLTSLWKDGFAELFEIPPLDRAAHDRLVVGTLGPVRAAGLVARLWQLTEGNPLFLRELLGPVADGDLEPWLESQAPVTPVTRLMEIVGSRTRQLSEPLRDALEVIAMAEPVSVDIVAEVSGGAALDELQRGSFVALDKLGGIEHARTVHPVYGATIRAMIPSLRRETIATRLAAAFVKKGQRRSGDALRAAAWLREVGRTPPPDVAVRAANEALAKGDAPLAESLAASAVERDGSVPALVALGTAMSMQQGRTDEAKKVLERALMAARGEDERVQSALASSRHHAWVGRDFAKGAALLEEMIPTLSGSGARSELRAEQAFFSAASGDAAGTIRIAEEVHADAEASPAAVLSSLIHSTRARTMLGWFDGLEEDLDRGESLAQELRDSHQLALDQISHNRALALRFVDLTAARRVASSGYERSLREGGPSGMWSGTLSWLSADAGDLDHALGLAQRAGGEFERFDPFHNLLMHRSLTALVHAVRGETDEACRWLERAGPLDEMEPRSRAWADRAAVWVAARAPERAAALAVGAGERAESHTIITWGASLLYHDAVRLGYPHLAVGSLARLADTTTAPLVSLMADHAQSAADRDVSQLVRVADEFEARGSRLLAAEALAQAARCPRRNGVTSAQLAARAVNLALACPGAVTPALSDLVSPLSDREREIASLAARGASSPEIAKRLFLSARTVDNHLGNVYRKLGLAGRHELSSVLTFAPPADDPHDPSQPRDGQVRVHESR